MIPCPHCDRHIPKPEQGATCPFCEEQLDRAESGGKKKLLIVGIGVGLTIAAATAYVLIDDDEPDFQNANQPVYGAVITF